MAPRNPRQVKIVSFGLWEIFRLRWEMAQRDIHATALALIDRRRRVQARVVLAGGQSLLHAGRVVQPLGLAVAVPRPLASVHAVLPAARHRVAPHPGMRHLVHVGHAVVHHGEPQRSTMKEVKSGKKKTQKTPGVSKQNSRLPEKDQRKDGRKIKPCQREAFIVWTSERSTLTQEFYPPQSRVSTGQSAPPATTRPNWRAELYDDAEL